MSGLRSQARGVIGFGFLAAGLVLIHPSGASAESKPAKPSPKRVAPKDRTEDVKSSGTAQHSDRCAHMVRRGDSLSRIAAQHRVTRQSIITDEIRREEMAYNPLHLLEAREAPVLASAPDAPLDDDEDRE